MFEDYDPTCELARAKTIPSCWYSDPGFLDIERARVFHRSWQWVGRTSDVGGVGDFFTCDVAGEPLVVARAKDGGIRAFSNVCRHRAGPVAEGKGNRSQLQCRYHGWTYDLEGKLRRAPEMEGVEDFDVDSACLPGVRVTENAPLLLVNLDEGAPSLAETLGGIPEEVAAAGFETESLKLVERREYVVDANWKVYVDNYLEGYHIPLVHPALFREVDYERYRVETKRFHSSQIAPLRPERGRDRVYAPRDEDDRALYYWVFPNLMLNYYPGNLQVNAVIPLDHERTLTVFEWYADGGSFSDGLRGAIEFSDEIQREDMEICRKVQAGLRSRTYDTGRLSVRRENGVHHFHRLLYEHLTRP